MAKLPKEPIKKRHTEYQDGVGNLPNGTYSMTERNAIMETKKKKSPIVHFSYSLQQEKNYVFLKHYCTLLFSQQFIVY